MFNKDFMSRAIDLSRKALDQPGLGPFGTVVVRDGRIIGEGYNQAAFRCDPTSHSEIEAIRDACASLQTINLEGSELYTSCEPCSLCVAAILLSGIGKVYYGASTEQSAQVMPYIPRGGSRCASCGSKPDCRSISANLQRSSNARPRPSPFSNSGRLRDDQLLNSDKGCASAQSGRTG